MNKGVFRLVYSRHLGMYVPASEAARNHSKKSTGSTSKKFKRSLASLFATSVVTLPAYAAQPAGLVPSPNVAWINASINKALTSANSMTITQTAPKAILNWSNFNLNKGEVLNMQDRSSWSALHLINDANPSVISGQINAQGHEYFYNANGIIFGSGAQINVGSLTATSLNITNDLFNAGVMTATPGNPNFSGNTGFVRVDQGATITTPSGGSVMLLAPTVTNSGVISTPDGQTILAAGQKVYLLDSSNPAGVLVEVDSGGTATNLGQIVAQHGNITMMGLAVNQQGVLQATTSVRANGSIYLKAQDSVVPGSYNPSTNTYAVARYGTVNIGQNSVTQVTPDLSDNERIIDAQAFTPSQVSVVGHSVQVDGLIQANGGNVSISTSADNTGFATNSLTTPQRVFIDSNASIDVSGVNTSAAMSENQLSIQLYSDQLKDAPLLRGGPLFGKTIYVDARKGTTLIDISESLAAVGKTVAEKLTAGGTVSINSTNAGPSLGYPPADVIINSGAKIDVSGGSVAYKAGSIKETVLEYNGQAIPIATASPNIPYAGTANTISVTDPKWGVTRTWQLSPAHSATLSDTGTYYEAYTDGKSAGQVDITSPNAYLNGTLIANTTTGINQRSTPVNGGKLQLNLSSDVDVVQAGQNPTATIASDKILSDQQKSITYLDSSLLQNGFNNLSISTGGKVTIDSDLNIRPVGSLNITGNIQVNNNITANSGNINFNGNTAIADNVTLSTAGLWTNDSSNVPGALNSIISSSAGNISVTGGTFQMGVGSLLNANAGAWLQNNGKLATGSAGNITLAGVSGQVNAEAYGFNKGGALSISSLENVQVGGSNPQNSSIFWLDSSFFSQGGFSKYSVVSDGLTSSMVIGDPSGAATLIHPEMAVFQQKSGSGLVASGSDISKVAKEVLFANDFLRTPVSLSFSGRGIGADTTVGDLKVLKGTTIELDAPYKMGAQGSITLDAVNHLSVLGSLIDPAGNIKLNLSSSNAVNYDATQSIFLGSNSYLSAAGFLAQGPKTTPSILNNQIMDGGSITINASKGSIIQQSGSTLDVSGQSGTLTVNQGNGPKNVESYGAAGSITISVRDGMVLDGTLLGNAAGTAQAGLLSLSLTGTDSTGNIGYLNQSDSVGRQFVVTQDKILRGIGLIDLGPVNSTNGVGQVSVEQIAEGGFDRVSIASGLTGRSAYTGQDHIDIGNGVNLKTATSISLDTQKIVLQPNVDITKPSTGTLQSAYISLSSENPDAAMTGSIPVSEPNKSNFTCLPGVSCQSTLTFNGNWIDINGKLTFSGVNQTTLSSQLDIRGRGNLAGTSFNANVGGWLDVPGELDLIARQIYPVTNSVFSFNATGTDGVINVKSSGQAPTDILSAGGVLNLTANVIDQAGVVVAPLGQIELDATNKLVLDTGSVTSVSANNQTIPYGQTATSGSTWFPSSATLVASNAITAPVEKKITFNSTDVELKSGSKVDVSGGGDLLAFEWINGIGGSQDILSQPGVYAVLPSMKGGEYAPFDYDYQTTTAVKPGESIYLSGLPGLAAGTYALLPARYALLPGAFMIQTTNTSVTTTKPLAQLDGSSLTAGYITNTSGQMLDSLWSTFKVTSGSEFLTPSNQISHAPSQYLLTSGNDFFTQQAINTGVSTPRLASDVGQVVFDAKQNLTLDGSLVTNNPNNGLGAIVDISSDKISVVSTIGPSDGTLQLTASSLNAMNAGSLLLGGIRSQDSDGLSVNTTASEVIISNDTNHSLNVHELMTSSKDALDIKANASIATIPNTRTVGASSVTVNGDGAFFAVSGDNNFTYSRNGSSLNPTLGNLTVDTGAKIIAGQSLVLDSTKSSVLNGSIAVGAGGSATFGANSILLGNAGGQQGLVLDNGKLSSLGALSKLTLNSYNNIDIYGPLEFGNSALNLTLNSGGIAGHMATGDTATITAQNLVLENTSGSSFQASANATNSTLDFKTTSFTFQGADATSISQPIGSGQTAISGFDTVNINATGEVRLSGVGKTAIQASNTNVISGRLVSATASDFTLQSTGTLTTSKIANPNAMLASNDFGGNATLQANSVNIGGDLTDYSGMLAIDATAGDVNVLSGANIDLSSKQVNFNTYRAYAPGGSLSLKSDLGSIFVNSNSLINVSGGSGGNAGSLSLNAVYGTATVLGALNGQAGAGLQSASFVMDVNSLANFSQINTALQSGSFDGFQSFRARTGDIGVASSDVVNSKNLVMTADTGNVNVYGTLNAQTANSGQISLNAGQNITLNGGSSLIASSTDKGAQGGSVQLSTSNGTIDLQSNSSIDVSSGAGGVGGQVFLRAPRTNNNTDIAISEVNSTFKGANNVQAEGFKTYSASTITTASQSKTGTYYLDAQSFMESVLGGTGVGLSRLGKAWNDGLFHIVPGIEFDSTSDLTLANDWSLSTWRFDSKTGVGVTNSSLLASGLDANGQPLIAGDLTLRAQGNLNVNGSLSDGFSTSATTGVVQGINSWSYHLVSGADASSANILATSNDTLTGNGNFTLANNKLIRTGTGEIDISAGGNFLMGNDASVIYTAGNKAPILNGFGLNYSQDKGKANYLENGGSIAIDVQGDITGQVGSGVASDPQQLINNWLFRQGGGTRNYGVSWWVRPDLFKEGVAAFGGGNIDITAGGDITNLSASIPTTAQYLADGSNSVIYGGGNLNIAAKGNIYSGVYFVGQGDLTLSAGQNIAPSSNSFGTVLALQNANANVFAGKNAFIETVFNPTLYDQSITNVSGLENNSLGGSAFFNTYSPSASVNVDALIGDVTFGLQNTSTIESNVVFNTTFAGFESNSLGYYPPTLTATSFNSNIYANTLTLMPSATGNLSLLAANNISADSILMSDASPSLLPNVNQVVSNLSSSKAGVIIDTGHAYPLLHANDSVPVSIVARDGSIQTLDLTSIDVTLPKSAYIYAGTDIKSLQASIQNNNTNDITIVEAGRDYSNAVPSEGYLVDAGPGQLLVKAGRNINLGSGAGISTIGNENNPALSGSGASITMLAGMGVKGDNLAGFISTYINPTGTGPVSLISDPAGLSAYRFSTNLAVTTYMQELTGNSNLSETDAMSQFLALDANRQAIFVYRQFSSELLADGRAFATVGNHNRGDNAITSLFGLGGYNGNIQMYQSEVTTQQGGSIDMLDPGGAINVGIPGVGGSGNVGMITQRGGDIRAYSESGFQVNQSKVITQFGGDITVWVNQGDIDAGRGSKTALSVPQRTVTTNADGFTTVNYTGVAEGSGIRAQTYDPDGSGPQVAPQLGTVSLLAPRGILNASEAGIAAGNFLAVATQVLGTNNISVSGTSSGVPVTTTGNIGGSLGSSSVGSDAAKNATNDISRQLSQSAAQDFSNKNFLPSFVSVEIIGLGDI